MIRVSVELTQEQAETLTVLAARRGCSVPDLIRQSIQNLLDAAQATEMDERRRRALAAVGSWSSGKTDISTNHDRYLVDAYLSTTSL